VESKKQMNKQAKKSRNRPINTENWWLPEGRGVGVVGKMGEGE